MLPQGCTTLRYRCHVACPSTGITTASPKKNGIDPSIRGPATINPHATIITGFAATALTDVLIAIAALMS